MGGAADLDGKVVIVTGGTSGIGRAAALALAATGARVVVAGRREAEGQAVLRAIISAGGEARFVCADVAIETDVRALVDEAVSVYGRIDGAFNNAGIAPGSLTTEITEADYRRVFDINVWGVASAMKYEIAAMLATGGGSIVNNSSVFGHVGVAGFGLYNASKHAVEGLTKTAALEHAKRGIRVNSVAPAFVGTPMVDGFVGESSARRDALAALHPVGRLGSVEEVAGAVLFLLSGASSFTTGTSLRVDGGWSAQ